MRRLAAAALLTFTALAAAAPAQAATNPYGPRQVCGTYDFRIIDQQPIATPTQRLGTTFLLYNAQTGFNCVVTMKSFGVGTPSPVTTMIERQGGPRRMESGNFEYYAGPRKVRAPGTCVRWGGGISVGKHSAGFETAFEHCG